MLVVIFDLDFIFVSSFHFWSSFCCCSSFVFSSFTFAFRRHPSPFRGLSPGFYAHFILSAQPIAEWFTTILLINHSVIFLPRALRPWVDIFLPTGAFYLMLLHRYFSLRLSRLPWEPAVLPWSLQGFILILKHRLGPSVCLIHSNPQSSYSEQFSFKFYQILSWIACGESLVYLLPTRFEPLPLVQSHT